MCLNSNDYNNRPIKSQFDVLLILYSDWHVALTPFFKMAIWDLFFQIYLDFLNSKVPKIKQSNPQPQYHTVDVP